MGIKTNEIFKKEIYDLVGDEYILLSNYKSAKENITMYHSTCKNIFSTTPNAFLNNGARCKYCNGNSYKDADYYYKKLEKDKNGEFTILTKSLTKRGHLPQKIFVKHEICGYEWIADKYYFFKNYNCPRCNKKERLNLESFSLLIKELVGDEYTLLSNSYKNTNTKVSLMHNICGNKIDIVPRAFISGERCLYCYGNKKFTNEEFKKIVYNIVGNEYEVVGEYVNMKTKVKMIHKKCNNSYNCIPDNFINSGARCPICNESKGEQIIRHYLEMNNIIFEAQKKYEDLLGLKGGNLSYDFYIPKYNVLIEFQGGFHDGTIKNNFQSNDELLVQQKHDELKRNYALKNNIDLLEIWHYEMDNIESILYDFFKQKEENNGF